MFNDENDVRHKATSGGHGNTLNDVVYFLSMVVFTKFDTCFEV